MIATVASMALLLAASAVAQAPVAQAAGPDPAPRKVAITRDIKVVRATVTESTRSRIPEGMVRVGAGEVVLGTPAEAVKGLGDSDLSKMTLIAAEVPRHGMAIDEFLIDATEVTNLQWKVFLEATNREPSDALRDYGWPGGKIPEGQEQFPVTNVNIPEIRDYLAWCGKRLPTEAEWVRAARSSTAAAFPWGDDWNKGKWCQSAMNPPPMPVAVDSHPEGASEFGVLNMSGNVFEWVDSPFVQYTGFEPLDWKHGREKIKISPQFNSTHKVIKGGAYNSTREHCRVDFRTGIDPSSSDEALGFRAALSAVPGLDTVRHAFDKLKPPSLLDDGIDEIDIFGIEEPNYDGELKVIKGYRFAAFAHRGTGRHPGYSRLKKDTIDEPYVVGILTTSEDLKRPLLPAGSYAVAFKGKGESKAHKERRKGERRGNVQNLPERTGDDVMVPWPGIPVNDVIEDVEFDQDVEALVFLNANNAIVGMVRTNEAKDTDVGQLESETKDDGQSYKLGFSLPTPSRRSPYFEFEIEFAGEPLRQE